jgi:hypothetical protein
VRRRRVTFLRPRVHCPGLIGLLTIATGCPGSNEAEVSGSVRYRGRPVRSGTVFTFAGDGIPHSSRINPDGTYSMKTIPAGPVRFSVQSPNPAKVAISPEGAQQRESVRPIPAPGDTLQTPNRGVWIAIPDRYGTPASSGLSTTLRSGINTFNIELQ